MANLRNWEELEKHITGSTMKILVSNGDYLVIYDNRNGEVMAEFECFGDFYFGWDCTKMSVSEDIKIISDTHNFNTEITTTDLFDVLTTMKSEYPFLTFFGLEQFMVKNNF